MIILGIDPGFGRVGYGVVKLEHGKYCPLEYGSITTQAGELLSVRLTKVANDLEEVLSRYEIDCASIEDLYFNTNSKTAIKVAEARGVMLYILQTHNIKIVEYTPLQVKQAIVGYGRADKIQIKSMVKDFLKLKDMPKLDDTTDALAIAICCGNSYKYESMTKK